MSNQNVMGKDGRFIIRRTVSQELFEELWRKHRNGETTLKDLAEMDEIINRDPLVRQFVLAEMENDDVGGDNNWRNRLPHIAVSRQSLVDRVKAFFIGFVGELKVV